MQDQSQLTAPVWMARLHWRDLPDWPLPPGYSVRWHQPGDPALWVRLQAVADPEEMFDIGRFTRAFGEDPALLSRRQCFLLSPEGQAIGTATAWFDPDFQGQSYGRVHWIAIAPQFQGKGLSKPLLSIVCRRLIELGHQQAYLKTSAARLRAIRLYASFGFIPLARDEAEASLWRELQARLSRLPGR